MSSIEPTRASVRADARNRAKRTFLQGLAVTGVLAVAGAVTGVVATWTGDQILSATAWVALGTSAAQAVLTSVASYVTRSLVPPASDGS